MGSMKQKQLDKRDAKAAARAEGRKRVLDGGGNTADWGSVDAELLRYAVAAVSVAGGAVRFGYTRDGGAYAIGVYDNGESDTDYVRPGEDINGYLRALGDDFSL